MSGLLRETQLSQLARIQFISRALANSQRLLNPNQTQPSLIPSPKYQTALSAKGTRSSTALISIAEPGLVGIILSPCVSSL